MIDTIVFRVHNLKSKYEYYAKYLRMLRTPDGEVIKYRSDGLSPDSFKTYQYYADSDKVQFLGVRGSLYVASSHYSINCLENRERDFIEVNVSVPKYVYGTNVFQFVDNRDETPAHVWRKFERFLLDIFRRIFPSQPDWTDVEIDRIDMCLNQIFASKEDALKYLANQKKLQVMHARSERNRFSEYGSTTIQYVTQNYTFKVYHKGTEYAVNDRKELMKRNPRNYDLKDIQDVADRTLRYEITYRCGGMNYVWKQCVKDDPVTDFSRNLLRMHRARTKEFKKFIEHDLNAQNFEFRMATEWDRPAGSLTEMFRCRCLTFTRGLFEELWHFFMKRVDSYQFDRRLTVSDVNDRLKAYADKKKALTGKTFDVSSLLVVAMLSQYADLRDLKGVLPKTTYYRYLRNLKEAEVPINNDVDVMPGRLDFADYLYLLGKYHVQYN